MANEPIVPRNPQAGLRDRRFQAAIQMVVNSLLEKGRIVRVAGNGNDWEITIGDSSVTVIASEVFSKRESVFTMPGQGPVFADAQQVLMHQVFAQRGSYGVIG